MIRRIFARGSWLSPFTSILLAFIMVFSLCPTALAGNGQLSPSNVGRGPVDHIILLPDSATIASGQTQSYLVTAYDARGNIWDATDDTKFSIDDEAGGSWSDNTYTSEFTGIWTVTGKYKGVTDDSILTVVQEQEAPPPEVGTTLASPDKDTEIKSPSGRITVVIPQGALKKQANIEFTEYWPQGSTGMQIVSLFELNASDAVTNDKINKFDKELRISIQHTPEELAGLDIDSLQLYYLDEETRQWLPLATSKFDKEKNEITAATDHFTHFGEMANPTIVGPGRVMASQVDLHSGAATFSYPFELPPGPGGFQPKLELTYNSASVDEMKNKQSVGSWVGIGWTLKLGSISYDSNTKEYFLDLNGASYQLLSNDDANYYTNPEQYLKITRSGNTWSLYDTDGTYYRFGGTSDSQQYINQYTYYRWDLSLMQDTNGNQATISYIQTVQGTSVRSAYPQYLKYNNNQIEVYFNSSYDYYDATDGYLRYDNPKSYIVYYGGYLYVNNPAPKVMDNRKLDSIAIKVNGTLIRQYNLAYNTTNSTFSWDYGGIYYAGTLTLTSITEVGANGTSQLPATTFSYQNLPTSRQTTESSYTGNPGNPASFNWPHLTSVNNGYGGTINFSYTQIPASSALNIWTREVVTGKTVNPGIGPNQTYSYMYSGNPSYLGSAWDQEYRGFSQVKETDAMANYVIHSFYTTGTINNKDAEKLTGREYDTKWYNSNSILLREKSYDWSVVSTGQNYAFIPTWVSSNTVSLNFNSPCGVAVDSQGYVYVADYGNSRIQKFGSSGNFILTWGSSGYGNGQFYNPCGVAVDSQGYVYVTDYSNSRIQKFDSSGNFILKWSISGPGSGVAVDSQGYVYVVDYGNSRIQKFGSSGNFILQWGSYGYGNGQFYYPSGIAVDSQGYVYVTDYYNNRTQKFDASGNFILTWGSAGSGNGQFYYPSGIAVDSQGYVYVTDTYNNRVQKFDANGNFILTWGSYGSGDGRFYPRGVAVDSQGYVYVADSSNNRVQKFDASGKLIHSWGDSVGQPSYPSGVAVDSQGYVYVTDSDYGNNRVQKFDANGNFILKWGSAGSSNGQFYNPYGVAVDSQGYVYITDYYNNRVQKFDSVGNFILTWGSAGSSNGQFYNPRGIAVDSQGYVYVVEYGNNRVQKFDSSGNFILKWGSSGTGNGQFYNPYGVAVDSQGYVYVVEYGNNRVQKFDSSGNFILKWGSQGSGDGQFYYPYGVAVDSQGYVYVANYGYSRVQKFDSSGNFILKWSGYGQFYPFYPSGVAVDSQGYVYVADYYNSRVQKFTLNWTVQLNQVDETIGTKTSRTRYVYDSYGNVITQYLDGDISTSADDATVWRTFYPNTTANILSKVARERVYATIVTSDNGGANLKKETLYYYDGNNTANSTPPTKGNLTRTEQKINASSSVSSFFTYDSYGNMLTSQDANGNTTIWTYDSTYHTYPLTISYPITGLSESATYDPGTNNVLTHTDINGQVTSYEYDTFKRLIKVIKPEDSSSSPSLEYQYNSWGTLNQQHLKTLIKIADGDYLWQSDYFDGIGRVVQTQARGETGRTIISATTVYNNVGQVDRQYVSQDLDSSGVNGYKAPEGSWKYTSFVYDGLGRVTTQTSADGTTVSTDYSTTWQVLATNQNGYKKRYYYDAFSRLVKVEELDASYLVYATTNYTYDTLGNLTQVVDNNSNTTTMSYDWLSRKIAMTDPDMGSWTYGYDNNGNLITQTDAKGQTITMTYDAMSRLTGKTYPVGSGMTDVTYTYDSTDGGNYGKGQRTGMSDASGTTGYRYDARGRLVEEKQTVDTVDYVTQYAYDGANRNTAITYPTGEVVTNGYNGRGLPYSLSGSTAGNLATSTLYNSLGSITEINLGNGLRTTFGYYGTGGTYDTGGGYYGRLWEIKALPQAGGTAIQDIIHTWDAGGNLTQREDVLLTETETFTYDFLDRLISASGPYTESYTYNQIGNITAMNGVAYTYGTQPHAVTTMGETTYSYDANGNMTTRSNQTLTWDLENRALSVTEGENTSTFVYDGNGSRVKKTESGETILYINTYYEKNLTTGEVTTSYYLGSRLIAQMKGTTLNYIHQDHLTGTSLMTDSSGNQVGTTMKYLPFGETRAGSVPTDKLFTGQRLDSTGLYYYGARYYDAGIGRFISADTVVPNPANPQALNRYSYCSNNPTSRLDPSGHYDQWWYNYYLWESGATSGYRYETNSESSGESSAKTPVANPSWSGWVTAYTMDTVGLSQMPVASPFILFALVENILSASGTLKLPVASSKCSVWTSTSTHDYGTKLDIYIQMEGEGVSFYPPVFQGTLDPPQEAFDRYLAYRFNNDVMLVPEGYWQTTRTIEMQQAAGPQGTQCFSGSILISPRYVIPLSVDLEFYYVFDSYDCRIWMDPQYISVNIETK